MYPEYAQDQLRVVLNLDHENNYNASLIALVGNGRYHVLRKNPPVPQSNEILTPDGAYMWLLEQMCRECPMVSNSASSNSMSEAE
jgi:hypothetical protein